MSGRGRGRGRGKEAKAPAPSPGRSREALARSLDALFGQFQGAVEEVERRVEEQDAALKRVEQRVEQLMEQHEELMLLALAREHRPQGRGSLPPRNQ